MPSTTSAIELVRDELTIVSATRMARMLRMTAVVVFVLVFSMAKRVPEAAVSAYMIFFIAQRDPAITLAAALGGVIGLTMSLALTFLCLALSIGEPAVRVPLMVAVAFAGMYVMRATRAGAIGLLLAFVPFYGLTFVDWVPSPEVLVRGYLWLWVFLAYPIGVLVLVELAFGTKPVAIYRGGIAERLAAAAAYLDAPSPGGRDRIARYVRLGADELVPYVPRSGPAQTATIRGSLLRQTELLDVLASSLPDALLRDAEARGLLQRLAVSCTAARDVLLERSGARLPDVEVLAAERSSLETLSAPARAVLEPLVTCVHTIVGSVRELARARVSEQPPLIVLPEPRPVADTREGVQFAAKATLAATGAYLVYTGLDWYGIHTATITCFFVAQASLGATIHKLSLRLAGAVVGAGLGMLAIIFVLPSFESIGGLAVLVGGVTLLAAWVATGTERVAYAGFQIAISFYLAVLQGYTRTTTLSVGRDRIIGIILGDILITLVFATIWPVRIRPAQRRALARIASGLAATLRTPPDDRRALDRAETELGDQIREVREYDVLVWFEGARAQRDLLLAVLHGLFVPVHAIARTPVPASASTAARTAMSKANESVAGWFEALAQAILADRPAPPLPAADPILSALAAVASDENETVETRTHARQHLAWLELLRAQCDELALRGPRHGQ